MKTVNEILLSDSYKLMPKQEVSMKNLKIARMRYVALLNAKADEHGLSVENLNEMDLVELRDMVDEYYPATITSYSGTVSGGTSKKVIEIKKAS